MGGSSWVRLGYLQNRETSQLRPTQVYGPALSSLAVLALIPWNLTLRVGAEMTLPFLKEISD
jgi:hypothetical protein